MDCKHDEGRKSEQVNSRFSNIPKEFYNSTNPYRNFYQQIGGVQQKYSSLDENSYKTQQSTWYSWELPTSNVCLLVPELYNYL